MYDEPLSYCTLKLVVVDILDPFRIITINEIHEARST